MLSTINEPISVIIKYNHQSHEVCPVKIKWTGKEYVVNKLGLHHKVRVGRTLHHIFSVQAENLFFRLNLDTETLFWRIEMVGEV